MQPQFPNAYVLNIMADDHPGIVSAVSSTVTDLGGNIDTASTGVFDGGSMLGTGAIIVMEDGTDMVDVARRLMRFFVHESCGKCTPCRVGTRNLSNALERIVAGNGEPDDIELLEDICSNMVGNTFCPMGEAAVNPVLSTLKHFRHEYQYYLDHKKPMTAA